MQPEINYTMVGQRIRTARLQKKLSQADLGSLVGCSNNHISHIETAQTKVSLSMLTKLALALDQDLDYFLLDTQYAKRDRLIDEEIAEKLNEKVAEGMINISMNTAPYFENGTAEGNVMIVNESINNYPQQVEFIRNDTGEQIYQSKAIPVGSKIERAALDVELPAGTYECTAMFHNLDPVSGEIIGTAGAIINITIKN